MLGRRVRDHPTKWELHTWEATEPNETVPDCNTLPKVAKCHEKAPEEELSCGRFVDVRDL